MKPQFFIRDYYNYTNFESFFKDFQKSMYKKNKKYSEQYFCEAMNISYSQHHIHQIALKIANGECNQPGITETMKRSDSQRFKLILKFLQVKNTLSIYSYSDFRQYIYDFRNEIYKRDKMCTLDFFCSLLGLNLGSKSYLSEITKGTRKLSEPYRDRFSNIFNLDIDETEYFKLLVKYNQTEDDEVAVYLDKLIQIYKNPVKIIDKPLYKYYKDWYNSIIRAVFDVYDFKEEYDKIASLLTPSISSSEVEASIDLLLELGLIHKTEEGFFKPSNKAIGTSDFVQDELIRLYQIEGLKLAQKHIESASKNVDHLAYSNVFSISKNGLNQILSVIQDLKDKLRVILNSDRDQPDRVYQLNLQIIPGTKIKKND